MGLVPGLLCHYSLSRHWRYVTAMGYSAAGHHDQDDHGGYRKVARAPLKIEQEERILMLFFLFEMGEEGTCNVLPVIVSLPSKCINP